MKTIRAATVWCCVLLGATRLLGHTVWVEPKEDKLVVRFAEPGDDFETSPGHLDSLALPNAFKEITNAPIAVQLEKKSDHFILGGVSKTNAVCLESIFTVRGGRKPHFYARWQPAGGKEGVPLLTFDLVPTNEPGKVRVYFRGQPIGDLKATLRTPDQKEHELSVDAEGFLRFESKHKGQHLLTIAHHREPIAGFHGGRAYQQTSHNVALTWIQP